MLAAGPLLTFHSAVSERQFFPMGTFCCCFFGQFNDAFVFFCRMFIIVTVGIVTHVL